MKIIVTHSSPDMDAITSVWLIRKFLMGWEGAVVQFVPAGERIGALRSLRQFGDSSNSVLSQSSSLARAKFSKTGSKDALFKNAPHAKAPRAQAVIEDINDDEIIHVDTGLGPLDHHQTASDKVCAASLTWDFIKVESSELKVESSDKIRKKIEAVSRMVKVVVDIDHFKEVFWNKPTSDHHEFSIISVLDGLKLQKPNQDEFYVEFISDCLDAILHEFENRIWAEEEIENNGVKFNTRYGKGIGFETINDSVIKLAQKMGYAIVVRKDPRKGYVRVKARPMLGSPRQFDKLSVARGPVAPSSHPMSSVASSLRALDGTSTPVKQANSTFGLRSSSRATPRSAASSPRAQRVTDIDLTLAYEKLRKMDPNATWFLHIGKKMLLNGSVKNPKMRPTSLGLSDIIKVLEEI